MSDEIGGELKVSQLKPQTVVWLAKEGRDTIATMWVVSIGEVYVHFRAGAVNTEFFAERCGADLETITDSHHVPMHIYEYLGQP